MFGIERDGVGVGARGRGRAKANKGGIALGGGDRLGMWGELSTSTESASLKADAMVGAAGGVDGGIGANEIGGEAEAFVGAKMGIEGRAGDEERASAGLRGEGWVGAGAKSKARVTFENGNLRGELGAGAGLGVGGYGEVSGSVNVGRIAESATATGEQVGTAAEEERRRAEEEARRRAEEERRRAEEERRRAEEEARRRAEEERRRVEEERRRAEEEARRRAEETAGNAGAAANQAANTFRRGF